MKNKIVIFGTGMFYTKRKRKLDEIENVYVSAFLDNDEKKWGTLIDNAGIYNPQNIRNMQYDYILLMSIYDYEMYDQLLSLGVEEKQILYWQEFYCKFSKPQMLFYKGNRRTIPSKNKILLINTDIQYNGGTMAAIYAATCLQDKDYRVTIAAPDGDIRLISEINNSGLGVVICNTLPYIYEDDWIKEYDEIIVNVFQMIQCACEISRYRPTLWWIHEARENNMYDRILKQFSTYSKKEALDYLSIYAVSGIARENFNYYFPNRLQRILCYGIPDMCIDREKKNKTDKISFAIIGTVCELKAQDIFINAARQMKDFESAEFWIIGEISENSFGRHIKQMIEGYPNIKLTGILSREKIYSLFPQIDVVVCASREETMSITMTEAMMFHKIGITTNRTGIAEYIVDGENGFTVEVDNVEMLSDRMQWIIDNKNRINEIGDRARETYEKFFTMESFGERLEKELLRTEQEWKVQHEERRSEFMG